MKQMHAGGMEERALFIERAGVMLELVGIPRVAGRVLGALLTAPPDGHTAGDLAALLRASRAGISTGTTYLTQVGLVVRAPRPGERADRFRMRPHAWATLMEQGSRKLVTLHDLAARGQQVLPPAPTPGRCGRWRSSTRCGCGCSPRSSPAGTRPSGPKREATNERTRPSRLE